jgi:hypothetical protein
MPDLSSTLQTFLPISLEEMAHVNLLNRIDTKFIIHDYQLTDYLSAISNQYSLLKIGGESVHPYETLYFDTPDFHLYQMHHNGKRNRYKLRCRKYTNTGIAFFEVKSKTNKDRTVKDRLQVANIPEMLDESLYQYINDHTHEELQSYIPALRVYFDRLTLVNKQANERLTFDMNLRYRCNCDEKKILNIVIVEVKQEKYTLSPFRELMRIQRQPRNYISKYCLGLTYMHKELKTNNFKHKFSELNKLGYDIH